MLPSCAAIGRDDGFVGEKGSEFAVVIGDVIRPQQGALAVDGNRKSVGVVGAAIVQEIVSNTEDSSFLREGDFGVVNLAAFLSRGVEILRPVLDPLDGSLQLYGQPGDEHLLRVEHHDLGSKAAADERRDHAHLMFRQVEHGCQAIANRDGSLGGVPYRQPLAAFVPVGDNAPILHRGRRAPIVDQAASEDQIGLRFGGFVIALGLDHMSGKVGAQILVDERRIRFERFLQIDHRRQHLIVHQDVDERIFSLVAALSHHSRYRFTHVAYFVHGQNRLGSFIEDGAFDRRWRDKQWPVAPVISQILGGVDGQHTFPLPSTRHIDAPDAGVCVGAAKEGCVRHLG